MHQTMRAIINVKDKRAIVLIDIGFLEVLCCGPTPVPMRDPCLNGDRISCQMVPERGPEIGESTQLCSELPF